MIIEVVGIDGAGKSTLVHALATNCGFLARKTHAFAGDIHARASAVGLQFGARAEATFRSLAIGQALLSEAALIPAGNVVYDRFVEGARMYFAVKDCWPIPAEVLREIPAPDLVVLIDVPVDIGLARRARPAEDAGARERAYMTACADWLRKQSVAHAWTVVDGTLPAELVAAQVTDRLDVRFAAER